MFEKEAEDKAFEKYPLSDRCDKIDFERNLKYEEGFKDGAEFGYKLAKEEIDYLNKHWRSEEERKANEWHYVKDELPRKSDSTLCELIPVFVAVKVGYHIETYGTYWNLKLGKFECLDEVYAWCYTPEPPELPKESD